MIMRKYAFFLILPILLSCTPRDKRQKIVFWQFWEMPVIQPQIEAFEKAHPQYKVEVEQLTWQNGFDKIVAAFASGQVPDLCELGSTWAPQFASEGVLLEVTDEVRPMKDTYLMWEPVTVGEKIYGFPWVVGTRALFYNKTLFAKAGLDSTKPPETWPELLNDAKKIKALGKDLYGYGENAGERHILYKKFLPFAWSNLGSVLSPDGKKAVLNSPENKEALEFLVSLLPYAMIERQDALDQAFKQGKIGFLVSGAWLLRTIPQDAPDLRYGVALIPKPEKNKGIHASFLGGEMLVVPLKAKNPEGAIDLVQFLIQDNNAGALSKAVKTVQPATREAPQDPYFSQDPYQKVFLEQARTAVHPPTHPKWVVMQEVLNDALEQAFYKKKTPGQALDEANAGIDSLLAAP
jgi:multiple sugar transport system substrate-binding protein